MANLELLRRYSEEFFGYTPTLFSLPAEVDTMSASFAASLEIPAVGEAFREFLTNVGKHPYVEALAFVIDAWEADEQDGRRFGGHVYLHYFVNEELSVENRPRWKSVIFLPHQLDRPVQRVLHDEKDRIFRMTGGYWDVSKVGLEQGMKNLIRTTFEADPGIWGVGRSHKEPPCGFAVAIINGSNA